MDSADIVLQFVAAVGIEKSGCVAAAQLEQLGFVAGSLNCAAAAALPVKHNLADVELPRAVGED